MGVTLSCFGDNEHIVEELSKAGSRALGQLIGKTKSNYDLGYSSFTKLFEVGVSSILDYGSGAWSVGTEYSKLDSV